MKLKKKCPNAFRIMIGVISIFSFIFIFGTILVACNSDSIKADSSNIEKFHSDSFKAKKISFFVDPETGVNYLITEYYRGISISPRYNTDGSLYVTSANDTK